MKRFLITTFTCLVFGATTIPVYANGDHHHPKADLQKSYTGKGEVILIDKTAGKVKLKHEPVPELDWPAMTMFFPVTNKWQLEIVNIGDQVEFEFVKNNGSVPQITQIKAIK